MPAQAGGCFVSGGSAANLSALVVARDCGRCPPGRDVRVAVSQDAHSSVGKALHVIGAGVLVVREPRPPADGRRAGGGPSGRPRPVRRGGGGGDAPGRLMPGIVDDLAGVAEVCRRRGLWFHVDAAYGGAALLSKSQTVRALFEGSEHADSFVVDPHKWLFAPFDCAGLLYREPALAKAVHAQHASYLDPIHTGAGDEWNPSDYAYHLTRRARGLALWYSLVVNGTDAYSAAVDAALSMAERDGARSSPRNPGWN